MESHSAMKTRCRPHRPPSSTRVSLEIIHCNRARDSSTQRCSCRKNSLECSSACGVCKGESCANVTPPDLDNEEEDRRSNKSVPTYLSISYKETVVKSVAVRQDLKIHTETRISCYRYCSTVGCSEYTNSSLGTLR